MKKTAKASSVTPKEQLRLLEKQAEAAQKSAADLVKKAKAQRTELEKAARTVPAYAKRKKAKTPAKPNPTVAPEQKSAAQLAGFDTVLREGEVQVGDVAVQDLQLTEREEHILAEPVDVTEVRILPSGNPYLPHPAYTRWMNRAFGRCGWGMRPANLPSLNVANQMSQAHVLCIHGKVIKMAFGEQDYSPKNKRQSYIDTIEATRASALRRCMKQLGVGLELWDPLWVEEFRATHCVVRWKDGDAHWRRKVDPPFHWEKKSSERAPERGEQAGMSRSVDPAEYGDSKQIARVETRGNHDQSQKIVPGQWDRLLQIATQRGRDGDEVKDYLLSFGYTKGSDIKLQDYETICNAIGGVGPLVVDVPRREV